MSTTVTQQQLAEVDYLYKKVINRKIKTDGLSTNTIISPANELYSSTEIVHSDYIWSDSSKLYAGPGPGVPATAQTLVQCVNIHNQPGTDVVTDLNGRTWNTQLKNWIPPEFGAAYLPLVYYGTSSGNATTTVDNTAYPYVFDYGSGILTFINTVPPYISSGNTTFLYVSGYTYSGILGLNSLNGTLNVSSNITTSNTLVTNNFNVLTGSTFNYNYNNLSNINTTISTNVQVVNLTTATSTATPGATGTINVSYNTLSNINTLSKVTTLDITQITTTLPTNTINMSQKTYTNMAELDVTTLKVDNVRSQSSSSIDFTGTALSNMTNVYLNPANTLSTNSISTSSGSSINFNGNSLAGINNLNMSGSLNIAGEFLVVNTLTSNTDRFAINNFGTGPALTVNQANNLGDANSAHIAEFSLASNVVFYLNGYGQTAIGSFGPNIPSGSKGAQLYVENVSSSNQHAVYIQQDNSSYNLLKMHNANGTASNVVFDGAGRLGMGTDTPSARIHVVHGDNTQNELLRLSNPNCNAALLVTADGRVGMGVAPSDSSTLTVKGVIRADNIVLGGGSGGTNLITGYGMVAPSSQNYLSFGGNDMQNIGIMKPNQIKLAQNGTQSSPGYTFLNDDSTGTFLASAGVLAFTAGGTEKMRVDGGSGNVGIGTKSMPNKLSVNGSVGIGAYAGTATSDSESVILSGKLGVGTSTTNNRTEIAGNAAIGNTYAGNYSAPPSGLIVEGAVGIGTHNYSFNNVLNVAGSVSIGSSFTDNNTAAPDQGGLIVAGNVGIGVTSSTNMIDISGSIGIGAAYAGVHQAPINGAIIAGNVGIGTYGTNVTYDLANKVNVAGSISIGAPYNSGGINSAAPSDGLLVSGGVAIGVTTYTNKVDINGSIGIGAAYAGLRQAPTDGAIIAGSVGIGAYGTGLANKVNVAGGVSIGSDYNNSSTHNYSAPSQGLLVQGGVAVGVTTYTNVADIAGNVGIGSTYAGLQASPKDGMIVAGNVGIGTYGFGLSNKLNVAGAVSIGSYAANNVVAPNPNSLIVSGTFGLGTSIAMNKADIAGGVAIGSNYAGVYSATDSGLIVQGSVGVGTTAPTNSLDVGNNASIGYIATAAPANGLIVSGKVGINSSSPTNYVDINGNASIGYTGAQAPSAGAIISGSVGIGTYNAVTGSLTNKLSVAGNVGIGATYAGLLSAPTDGMIIAGNVGVGTYGSSLANKVNVAGSISIGAPYNSSSINRAAPTDGLLVSGSVGIGTTSYTNKVDINGSIGIGAGYAGLQTAPANGAIIAGNVGIGTYGSGGNQNLANKVNVAGSISIGAPYNSAGINRAAPSDGLLVYGNVGVGVTSYTNKIDINGNVGIGSTYAGLQASPTDGMIVAGNVGIGTYGFGLSNKLNVAGAVSIGSYAANNVVAPNPNSLIVSGTLGLGTSNAMNVADIAGGVAIGSNYAGTWSAPDSGLIVQGSVGIGSTAPVNTVDISGGVGIGATFAGASAPTDGAVIAGSVGIGTSGANLSKKLNVAGNVGIGTYAAYNITAPTNGLIVSGNVGVGSATPVNKIDVSGNVGIGGSFAGAAAPADGMIVAGNVGIGISGANIANKLSVTERVAIGSYARANTAAPNPDSLIVSGTVGVGTALSTNKVDIAGAVAVGSSYAGQVTSPTNGLVVQGKVGINTNGNNLNNWFNVAGNVGIGTYATNNTSAPANGLIVSGNVGVGSATPVNKIDVSGNVGIGGSFAGAAAPADGMIVAGGVGIGVSGAGLNNKLNVAGNVGIGTYATGNISAPANGLIVSGTIGVGTALSTNKVDIAGGVAIGSAYAGQVAAQTDGLLVKGKVGVNVTTSTNYVDLAGNVGIGATYAGLQASPTDGMIIAGNVGIGTYGNNLTNKLNVAGAVSIGDYAANNVVAPNPNSLIVSGTLGLGTSNSMNVADIAGGVAIGSNYAGVYSAPDSGLIVQGKVGIGRTSPQYTLDLGNTGPATINTPNLQVNRIVTTPGKTSIDMTGSTLSNVSVINVATINTTGSVSSSGNLSIGSATDQYANNLTTAALVVTGGVAISRNILVGDTTDSTSSSTGAAIIYGGAGIAKNLNVGASITAATTVNAPQVVTPSITSATGQVSMNYNRVLDIDSLVVRSNITVSIAGTATYTNLPTNLVSVDAGTGRILDQYISSNIVRLMSDGTINPALLPTVPSGTNTLLRTTDKVGIGLRNPQQKLHVYGNQCVTGGYIGIGTIAPQAPLHVYDDNGTGVAGQVFKLQEQGSADLVGIYGSGGNTTPVLYINATSNVGINTLPSAGSPYSLDVSGKIHASTSVRTNALESDSGTINCQSTNFTNILGANITNLTVTGTVTLPNTNLATTTATSIITNTITAPVGSPNVEVTSGLFVSGLDNTYNSSGDVLVTGTGTNIGLRVSNSILGKSILTISDRRVKMNVTYSPSLDDMVTISNIPVHRFNFIETPTEDTIGFIAQEVEQYAPYAVSTTSGPIPNVMKNAVVDDSNPFLLHLDNHGLNINDKVKLLIGDVERIATVTNTTQSTFTVDNTLQNGSTVFVFGIIVNDFKVLENERLIPLIFNGVKLLNSTISQQQRTIQDLINRVTALETKMSAVMPAPSI